MPSITRDNVGTLTVPDMLGVLGLFEGKYEDSNG